MVKHRIVLTPVERALQRGFCAGGAGAVVPVGGVGLDKRASCTFCGKRVGVTARGRFAHHQPIAPPLEQLEAERRATLRIAAYVLEGTINDDDEFRQEESSGDFVSNPVWRRREKHLRALVRELRRRGEEPPVVSVVGEEGKRA